MRSRIDIWIEWGIQPIRCFLEEVPFHFEQLAASADVVMEPDFLPDGRLGKRDIFNSARALSLVAVVERLNALVDEVLLVLASSILHPHWSLTSRAMSRSRKQLLDAIAHEYGVDVANLPGWSQVEAIREDANSLKHRGGIRMPEDGPGSIGIPIIQRVQLDVDALQGAIEDVRMWLLALWSATEGAKPNDSV